MTDTEDFQYVENKMRNEGFDYCFIHYSNFDEIKDKEFHKLRKRYIKAQKALKQYITDRANFESNEL